MTEESRVKELILELDGLSSDEIEGVARELADISLNIIQTNNQAESLAKAVLAFADWQSQCYKGEEGTQRLVGQSLWHEVSDCVYAITGTVPSNPCARS